MGKQRVIQEVNAGSMADIAFLLLIFFLVTASIESDAGLNRMMPPINNENTGKIKERNLFKIGVNDADEIMADGEVIQIESLRERVVAFLDNGGLPPTDLEHCSYCRGEGRDTWSENPQKAILSIKTQRNTGYPAYVAVQNEVLGAYKLLRDRESRRMFGISFQEMETSYYEQGTKEAEKARLKERIESIRELFPQKILEVQNVND